jgi:predicted DNA-binding protein
MLAINLEPELERQVAELAKRNGQSVDAFVHDALERLIEDFEDLVAAEAALRDYDPKTNVRMAEVKRRLGLDS